MGSDTYMVQNLRSKPPYNHPELTRRAFKDKIRLFGGSRLARQTARGRKHVACAGAEASAPREAMNEPRGAPPPPPAAPAASIWSGRGMLPMGCGCIPSHEKGERTSTMLRPPQIEPLAAWQSGFISGAPSTRSQNAALAFSRSAMHKKANLSTRGHNKKQRE